MADIQQSILPALRQDLRLLNESTGEDGSPVWLLFDPARNRYFRMGRQAFELLREWRVGAKVEDWLAAIGKQMAVSVDQVSDLLRFLQNNHLLEVRENQQTRQLLTSRQNARGRPLNWLLTHYLYIRIPLFRPDRFLEATLGWVAWMFGAATWPIILSLGAAGLFLVSRQWDLFVHTFSHFFSAAGMGLFVLSLVGIKTIHELGHAYTAKYLGCRVPTMGVAFMVLYPMLYTDTTDSWRIVDPRQRLRIATAGVKAELALAMLATFAWGFLQDGSLRSAAFFIATTSWLTSLTVNISPFMRFDGYYALSDWLNAENLQPRAFALARWQLRKVLFGVTDPPPEMIAPARLRLFVLYALGTWIYRFLLFLGIALLVYHLAFKALGIFLFVVEIYYFILAPVLKEIKTWKSLWARVNILRKGVLLSFMMVVLLLFFLPWRSSLVLPALWKADVQRLLFPKETGRIQQVHVRAGQRIKKGKVLFELVSDELDHQLLRVQIEIDLTRRLLDRYGASAQVLSEHSVLQRKIAALQTERNGLLERRQHLTVRAPMDGRIYRLEGNLPGRWVSRKTPLASLVTDGSAKMEAFVQEGQLAQVQLGAHGRFVANVGTLPSLHVQVAAIDNAAVVALQEPMMASHYGGPVAARLVHDGVLRPEQGTYRIELALSPNSTAPDWPQIGKVCLAGPAISLAERMWQRAAAVLIRESGF